MHAAGDGAMKTCECGGKLYRHGKNESGRQYGSERYRCASCGKTITVRDGQIVDPHIRPSRIVNDWRHAA